MLTWIKSLLRSPDSIDQFSDFFAEYEITQAAKATIRDLAKFASQFHEEDRRVTCRLHAQHNEVMGCVDGVQMELWVNHCIRQSFVVLNDGSILGRDEGEDKNSTDANRKLFKLGIGMALASAKSVS